jgi:hypothetical protein
MRLTSDIGFHIKYVSVIIVVIQKYVYHSDSYLILFDLERISKTIDSVAASFPVVTLYQVDHNRSHKFKNMRSAKRYKLHIHVLLEYKHELIGRMPMQVFPFIFVICHLIWLCKYKICNNKKLKKRFRDYFI